MMFKELYSVADEALILIKLPVNCQLTASQCPRTQVQSSLFSFYSASNFGLFTGIKQAVLYTVPIFVHAISSYTYTVQLHCIPYILHVRVFLPRIVLTYLTNRHSPVINPNILYRVYHVFSCVSSGETYRKKLQ